MVGQGETTTGRALYTIRRREAKVEGARIRPEHRAGRRAPLSRIKRNSVAVRQGPW